MLLSLNPLLTLLTLTITTTLAATILTGDIIDTYPVISSLDIRDIPSNKISRYWFYAGTQAGSIPLYLPILVARGTNSSLNTGRKLSLSASLHGDELNGVSVVHRVFRNETFKTAVEEGRFNGTVIGLPTLNPNGNQHSQRLFYSGNGNGRWTDLNSKFPGSGTAAQGFDLATVFAYNIWNGIWGNTANVDVAVDFHGYGTDSSSPMWVYADYRFPYVRRMAELTEADLIKIDPGAGGTIETTFIEKGVPAITLEIGSPKLWQEDLIDRTEAFVYRLMDDLQMYPNSTVPLGNLQNVSSWTDFSSTFTTRTGWVEPKVKLLEMVVATQIVALVYNSFGDAVETLRAAVAGQVYQVRTNPIVEQGTEVVGVAYNSSAAVV